VAIFLNSFPPGGLMRVVTALLCLVVSPFLSLAQTQKHPFSFEDMMALKRVEEPVPSPDGKWVLFAAVDVDLKANTKTPHIRVVAISGGEERELFPLSSNGDRPRWSPDGKRFAFISNAHHGSQIWIAGFDSATGTVTGAHEVTDIATEASGELWSPDGKNILFKSDVYPECDGTPVEETNCNAKKIDEAKNSRVKGQIFTHLLYRHWNAYKEGKRSHLLVLPVPMEFNEAGTSSSPVVGSSPRDLTPGDYDAPVFSLSAQDNYAFSPDGREVCYSSNHDAMPAASTNNDLFTVLVDFPADAPPAQVLAATRNITADNKAADNTPLYSPDGKYIAYRAQARPGDESDRWRLMLYDRKRGERKNQTETLDEWVGTFTWSPNSKRIFFVYESEGEAPVYSFEVNRPFDQTITVDGDAKETARYNAAVVVRDGFNDDVAVTPDGKTIVFTRMSISFPNEIDTTDSERTVTEKLKHPAERLTHFNDAVLSTVLMSPLESFWFTGAHNDKVQGFLVKPPNFDPSKKYPVKFLIHGGPEGAWGDDWSYRWNPELFAANGYVVIMINFHGSTGYGQNFVDAINGDWGGAPFEDLMKGLDYAEQHYPFIDKNRECALGASYGGYMANWILGHTDRFKCIVSHDGLFNTESAWGDTEELWFNEWEFKGTPYTNRELYRKWSPHLSATNFKTPTLVVHGQLDYRLDVSQGFDLFTTLQRQGVRSKMLYFPDEGHWVLQPQNSRLWYKTVNDWVDQWVGK
jgi:dipeptidyl aminopeptidase/acylaminoacyl peptidase